MRILAVNHVPINLGFDITSIVIDELTFHGYKNKRWFRIPKYILTK